MRIQRKIKHTFIYIVVLLAGFFLKSISPSLILWMLYTLGLASFGAFCLAILNTVDEREVTGEEENW